MALLFFYVSLLLVCGNINLNSGPASSFPCSVCGVEVLDVDKAVCMYVCMFACMYVCICILIHKQIYYCRVNTLKVLSLE